VEGSTFGEATETFQPSVAVRQKETEVTQGEKLSPFEGN